VPSADLSAKAGGCGRRRSRTTNDTTESQGGRIWAAEAAHGHELSRASIPAKRGGTRPKKRQGRVAGEMEGQQWRGHLGARELSERSSWPSCVHFSHIGTDTHATYICISHIKLLVATKFFGEGTSYRYALGAVFLPSVSKKAAFRYWYSLIGMLLEMLLGNCKNTFFGKFKLYSTPRASNCPELT
jgi:hypothetical protein